MTRDKQIKGNPAPRLNLSPRRSLTMSCCKSSTMSFLDLPEMLLTCFLNEWLVMKDICALDQAITSTDLREHWLLLLQTIKYNASFEAWEHSQQSIRWMISRHVSLYHMVVKFTDIKSNTFANFKMSTLKSFRTRNTEDFHRTSYRVIDKCLVNIGQGCPNLETIHLGDFITLTEPMVQKLQDYCPNLKVIGNGHVVTKRRAWHEPYNLYCRSFICAMILTYLEVRHSDMSPHLRSRLRNISRKVERALYMVATSQEEYVDVMSLKARLRLLVQQKNHLKTIIEQGRVVEG